MHDWLFSDQDKRILEAVVPGKELHSRTDAGVVAWRRYAVDHARRRAQAWARSADGAHPGGGVSGQMDSNGIEFLMVAGAPTPVAPFSHAVAADGWLFVTGQMPTDPDDDARAAARGDRGADAPGDRKPASSSWPAPAARSTASSSPGST